jgi:hypothetical protein
MTFIVPPIRVTEIRSPRTLGKPAQLSLRCRRVNTRLFTSTIIYDTLLSTFCQERLNLPFLRKFVLQEEFMIRSLLAVTPHEAVAVQLLDELGPRFPSTLVSKWEITGLVVVPGKRDATLVAEYMRSLKSKDFAGAVFYNCTIKNFWKGSDLPAQFCEEFVKKNPECIVSYHYNDESLMPSSLEQLKRDRPYFHYSFESDPREIAEDFLSLFQNDVLKSAERELVRKSMDEKCSTSPS